LEGSNPGQSLKKRYMVSQKRLHQLEQHEKDMEDGITASDSDEEDASPSPEEETPEKETPDAENEQAENEKEEVVPEAAAEDNAEASSSGDESSTAAPKRKRRRKKVFQPAELEAMTSKPSLWPLITAFSVAVVLAGAISSHIVLGIGFVLVLGSIIGWLRERR
jgi:hypothetical protein